MQLHPSQDTSSAPASKDAAPAADKSKKQDSLEKTAVQVIGVALSLLFMLTAVANFALPISAPLVCVGLGFSLLSYTYPESLLEATKDFLSKSRTALFGSKSEVTA